MPAFDYSSAGMPIRSEIVQAHRVFWNRLAAPGTWWSGPERVAIAEEVRSAHRCGLCRERKVALSPNAVAGAHPSRDPLSEAAVEAIHRVTTDPARLSRPWLEKLQANGLGDAPYVELIGIVVAMISVDQFHRGLGLALEPLPEAILGEPSRQRPSQAVDEGAWVPMIPAAGATGSEADLWPGRNGANVIRALSLVPEAVRDLKSLSAAHYFELERVSDPAARRSLDRPQIELVAGRVSAINECFY